MNGVKISFYFTLWICAWIFIELLGVPAGFSFWCALILVIIIGKIIEAIFSKSIESQQYQEKILRWEQIFGNDKEAYIREKKKKQIPIESLWLTFMKQFYM